MDYTNIGLNEYLQPISAPISNRGIISSYDFDGEYERGVVNTAHVKQISAEKIQTGTLQAGVNIVIRDFSTNTDVILIGYQEGGF